MSDRASAWYQRSNGENFAHLGALAFPYFDRTYIITGDGEAEILVAYTEFADQIGSSDRGDSIFIGPFVYTVAEVRLTQVDGSQFAAREYEVLLLPYE